MCTAHLAATSTATMQLGSPFIRVDSVRWIRGCARWLKVAAVSCTHDTVIFSSRHRSPSIRMYPVRELDARGDEEGPGPGKDPTPFGSQQVVVPAAAACIRRTEVSAGPSGSARGAGSLSLREAPGGPTVTRKPDSNDPSWLARVPAHVWFALLLLWSSGPGAPTGDGESPVPQLTEVCSQLPMS